MVDHIITLAALRRARLLFRVVHEGVGLGVRGRAGVQAAAAEFLLPYVELVEHMRVHAKQHATT